MFENQAHNPRRVVVLAGGDSSEREISLISGGCVVEALQSQGHECRMTDPAKTPLQEIDWNGADACFIALHGGAGDEDRSYRIAFDGRVGAHPCGRDAAEMRLGEAPLTLQGFGELIE